MFHVADFALWTGRNLLGGTHLFLPGFTPASLAETIERHRVTDTVLVPTMIQMLVDAPEAASADLSSLRYVFYGASPISEAVLTRAFNRLPTTEFTQSYGMTELSPCTTILTPTDHRNAQLLRSAGRAAPHSEVRIMDTEGKESPRGTIGEICSRGGHMMLGYWNRPAETQTALRDGWMHSGDGGYMDSDGYIFVADRFKDMIVSGGENVYSVEVENALATHPAVASCAVIGVPDEHWGERVHAVIVPAGDSRPCANEIRDHVIDRIAGYKAPRSVEYVTSLPLSASGKVLKRELRRQYWTGRERNVS
jgi:acyl-CoA synthetase (AMP-forming)/AMP-acid ligase II